MLVVNQFPIDGHLSYFQFFTLLNSAVMNSLLHISLHTCPIISKGLSLVDEITWSKGLFVYLRFLVSNTQQVSRKTV